MLGWSANSVVSSSDRASSSSTATTRPAFLDSSLVRIPRPGPISSTVSSGTISAAFSMRPSMRLSTRKFCPRDFLAGWRLGVSFRLGVGSGIGDAPEIGYRFYLRHVEILRSASSPMLSGVSMSKASSDRMTTCIILLGVLIENPVKPRTTPPFLIFPCWEKALSSPPLGES